MQPQKEHIIMRFSIAASVSVCLAGALASGCVTVDGSLSKYEQGRILKKFTGSKVPGEPPMARGNQYAASEAAAEFGRYLFFYKGFTANSGEPTACASCHDPGKNFSDGRPRAIGASGRSLAFKSPSLYQTSNRHFLFWDGRIDSTWAQALMPIEDSDEMGGNRLHVLHAIHDDPTLKKLYEGV
jgi:cytochrome c peroxidase